MKICPLPTPQAPGQMELILPAVSQDGNVFLSTRTQCHLEKKGLFPTLPIFHILASLFPAS